MSNTTYRKKLIEVALPLDAINRESVKEKEPFTKNHPRSLHIWWARRPLAACRAVLFAQLVDDPSSHPGRFPTEEAQKEERNRLFNIIEEMVKWENINNEQVLHAAREEILKSTGGNPPPVLDPFCGGGSIPLEAQRLGLKAYASDLNPVAVLITKALIEIPPKFAGLPPVNPGGQTSAFWHGAKGLAEDVRYYGKWMRDEAEKRIGHLYPRVKIPKEYGGGEATVIAWIWARTVKCPNPACGAQMPLVRSFALSTKKDKQAWVEPIVDRNVSPPTIRFEVRTGQGRPQDPPKVGRGAKFRCLACGQIADEQSIRGEFQAKRNGQQMIAIVAEGPRRRIYLPSDDKHVYIANEAVPKWKPEQEMNQDTSNLVSGRGYGITHWHELFTPRQLVVLTTFSDLVIEARERVLKDAIKAEMSDDGKGINDGGNGAKAYASAVSTYLSLAVSRWADLSNTICSWNNTNQNIRALFSRQAIPMTWDFAELNPFGSLASIESTISSSTKILERHLAVSSGLVQQLDITSTMSDVSAPLFSTDPPYYDNIGYADLSDFFYMWLRRSLGKIYPDLFSTMLVPKAEELVATPYRFNGNKKEARRFFEDGLRRTFIRMKKTAHPEYPLAVYYAFKQAESDSKVKDGNGNSAVASTGWETMLEGLLASGFQITGTWPMRTERSARSVSLGTNALASSIILACRPRPEVAPMTTRRDFINTLKRELPPALKTLQQENIAPVDLAQSAIGPGMAIFSRYTKVLEADGASMRIRAALALINQVLDEYLTEQEGEYDADTRWALAWFEQFGMMEGPYGVAEILSKAKNTAVGGLVKAGIIVSKAGKVRILRRDELSEDWDPTTDKRLTVWEVTQHLIHAIVDKGSEEAAADLLRKVGALGDVARDLAYRLYTICDRKKWAQEALAYNSLVVAWPELVKLAGQKEVKGPSQQQLFEG